MERLRARLPARSVSVAATAEKPRTSQAAMASAFGAMFLWGLNYSFAKLAVEEIDPLAVALVRIVVATPLFFLALARDGEARFTLADLKTALPLGLSGVLANQIFFITGIRRTTPSHSSLVVALLPITVLLLANRMLGERLTRMKTLGMLVALAGIVLISFGDGWTFSRDTLWGDFLTFCGVCAFAYYTVAGRTLVPRIGALRASALAFLIGGVAMVPLVVPAALRQDWNAVTPVAWGSLAYVVLIGTVACYFLYYWALGRIESGKVAAFMYLQPVIAGVTSYLLLGETLQGHFLLGGLAVLSGVFLAERG